MEKKDQLSGGGETSLRAGESVDNFVNRIVNDSNQLAECAKSVLDVTRQINAIVERVEAIDQELNDPSNAQRFSDSFADNNLREERDALILKAEELELKAKQTMNDFKSKKVGTNKKEYIM